MGDQFNVEGATLVEMAEQLSQSANLERNNLDVYLSFIEQLGSRAQQQQAGAPAPGLNL